VISGVRNADEALRFSLPCVFEPAAQKKMVVTKQVSSQLEWLSTLSTTFDAMDENEKFLRKVGFGLSSGMQCHIRNV
jgi:hypothetical protein